MCEDCFKDLIYKFQTQQDFERFEIELQKKCSDEKLKIIDRHHSDPLSAFDSYLYYQCRTCKEMWLLSIPDNAWRGFFLPEEKALEHVKNLKKQDKKKEIGCLIFLVTIVIIIILNWIG